MKQRMVFFLLVRIVSLAALAKGFTHPGGVKLNHRLPLLTSSSTALEAVLLEEKHQPLPPADGASLSLPGLLDIPILPARKSLESFLTCNGTSDGFSILSWNILLPNSQDNWWNHKMYNPWVAMEYRQWAHRQALIRERLLKCQADIICLQEADGDTFDEDFAFLLEGGEYEACLHNKYRFRCATFFKRDKFELDQVSYRDRALVTSLKVLDCSLKKDDDIQTKMKKSNQKDNGDDSSRILYVVNCHLSGGAAPERRLRQVHQALDQIRKWKRKAHEALQKQEKANRPNPKNIQEAAMEVQRHESAATLVCGDFNSDGNTGVRRLLVEGSVDSEWREPQYPAVSLTSSTKTNPLEDSCMVDAAELAYGANVCDGDYGEHNHATRVLGGNDEGSSSWRPPTYVVPNLASLLLLPPDLQDDPLMATTRTEFGVQVAQGLADTLGLQSFSREEMEHAFATIDLDGNNHIDEAEVQSLLESVYVATYGEKIRAEKKKFFQGFQLNRGEGGGLTREQFAKKLMILHQEQQHTISDTNDFGKLLPKGIMDALGVQKLGCEKEMNQAFESIDRDGNNVIDEDEVQSLLETVYLAIYGEQIKVQRASFFSGFRESRSVDEKGLSREQFVEKLTALQQELVGGSEGSELVEVRTEMDAQRMITRFSPLLRTALDHVFDVFSSDGDVLTDMEIDNFLIKVNGDLGRGGISRHTAGIFETKTKMSQPRVLCRDDWYGVFARELGEGKWWQVVYDLESCGADIRSENVAAAKNANQQHYQAWLDYLFFDSQKLQCQGFQEALTKSEESRIYKEGDTLPNEWHPSDHLPVAAIFSWTE